MSKLKIAHCNCFKLTQARLFELEHFLNIFKPDIISLQEIKLELEVANLKLRFEGYVTHVKTREIKPSYGGGVAILIKQNIPQALLPTLDYALEIIGINIDLKLFNIDFFSYYSPPNKMISQD